MALMVLLCDLYVELRWRSQGGEQWTLMKYYRMRLHSLSSDAATVIEHLGYTSRCERCPPRLLCLLPEGTDFAPLVSYSGDSPVLCTVSRSPSASRLPRHNGSVFLPSDDFMHTRRSPSCKLEFLDVQAVSVLAFACHALALHPRAACHRLQHLEL